MKDTLKSIGSFILGICILAGVGFFAVMLLTGGVWLGERVYPWLIVITAIALFVTILVLLPLAIFRHTRAFAGGGIYIASFVFGLTLWVWSLLTSYTLWGIGGVLVGLFLAGVGVVPIAIIASLFHGLWSMVGELLLVTAITFGTRFFGIYLMTKAEAPIIPPNHYTALVPPAEPPQPPAIPSDTYAPPEQSTITAESQESRAPTPGPTPPQDEQAASRPPRKANYFVRHWRGELSLGVSYWLNGFLIYLIVAVLAGFLSVSTKGVSLRITALAIIAVYLLSLVASGWQAVGVWRSASRHAERGGQQVWATLAKLAVVIGLLNLIRFTANTVVPQTMELASIALGDARIPPYEIRVLPGGNEIEFRGGIRAGAAKELERIVNAVPQAKVLHINSIGGRIHEAKEMADIVRSRGFITYTSDECLSAATLVLLAGKERVVAAKAKVGFHQPSLAGMTDEQKRDGNESARQTMRSAGISDEFINQALATPPDSMWYPSIEEMQRAGVITSESFGERFAVSGALLRSASREDAEKVFASLPGFRAIKDIEPATYQKMVADFSAAILSGKSLAEAQNTVSGVAQQMMLKHLPLASDEALRTMRDLWVELLVRFKDKDSRACIAVISPQSSPSGSDARRIASQWSGTNHLIVMDQVLRSAAAGTRPQLDAATARRDLATIHLELARKYSDGVELLANESKWMSNSDRVCDMLLALYHETQNIPEDRQGNLLRYMLSNEDSNSSETAAQSPARRVTSPPPTEPPATGAASLFPGGTITYTVKSGDSLTKIAGQFGTTINALRSANGLGTYRIRVGQTLRVPPETSTSALADQRVTARQGPEEAARSYRKAAEQGDAISQRLLGICYEKGQGVPQDYAETVKWYRKAAEQGDAISQCFLGFCYEKGRGVPQDYAETVKWYCKAAEQGNATAQWLLGICYCNGKGVQQDYVEAVKWYREAAERGDATAQCSLGNLYRIGRGVTKDEAEAVKWYRKAADQGYTIAQASLGTCYSGGRGVPQDYVEAVKWYRKAAEQGAASGQNSLGACYAKGQGVAQDHAEAVKWFRKAAGQGYASGQSNLGRCYAKGQGVAKDELEAVKWYRKALDGGHEAAAVGLAEAYLGQGNKPEAMKALRKGLAFYEKQVQSLSDEAGNYSGLSWANLLCGQAKEGEAQARKGLNAKAVNRRTTAYLKGNLGHALLCQGLTTQAIEQYRDALRLGCEKDTFLDDFRLMKLALPEFKERIEAAEKEVASAETRRDTKASGPVMSPAPTASAFIPAVAKLRDAHAR